MTPTQSSGRFRVWQRRGWDAVAVLGLIGVAYGSWELIEANGWVLGILLAVVSLGVGAYFFQVIYPLWFRD
jgi:uncharacterized membrane protein HdeD (DUF308 family)